MKNCSDDWLYAFLLKSYQAPETTPNPEVGMITTEQQFNEQFPEGVNGTEPEMDYEDRTEPEEPEPIAGTAPEPERYSEERMWLDPMSSLYGTGDPAFDWTDDTPDFTNY